MKIALDYDQTFTEDPTFWAEVVALAKRRGHSVTFVTARKPEEQWDDDMNNIEEDAGWLDISIVYTSREQKAKHFDADIWIDDSPQFIPTADELKRHCDYFNVGLQLTYPVVDMYDMKKGQAYVGKVHADGRVELFSLDGNPCPRKHGRGPFYVEPKSEED